MKASEVYLPILSNGYLEDKRNELVDTIDTVAFNSEPHYDTAITTTTTATTPADADTRPKFRSQYPTPTDLPDIVRDMTWYDPFYNNEKDAPNVIAVFDIDRTKYNQDLWNDTFLWIFIFFIIFGTAAPIFAVMFTWYRITQRNRVASFHVAMTCNCIIADKLPFPGSTEVIHRKVIPFHEIQSCFVQWEHLNCMGSATPKIVMVINDTDLPVYFIRFIPNSQEFVNIVNVMKERSSSNVTNDNDINTTTMAPFGDSSLLSGRQQEQQSSSSVMDNTRNHADHQEEDILVPVATIVPFDSINVNVTDDTTAREIV